jgi:hypothetical protein
MTQSDPHFVPVREARSIRWRRAETFAMLADVPFIWLSETELLQTAHHLPIAVNVVGGETEVVGVLDQRLLDHPLLDDKLRWTPAYTPIQLRCLPFGLAPAGAEVAPLDRLMIGLDLGLTGAGGEAIFAAKDTLTKPAETILAALRRLEVGQKRLAAAADMLMLAGLLAPLGPGAPDGAERGLYGTDGAQLGALSALRCAAAAHASFLPLELAVGMLFSQRHVQHHLRPQPLAPVAPEPVAAPRDLDLVVQGVEQYQLQLDTSELFRIDELLS